MYSEQDYLLDQIRYSERISMFLETIKRTRLPRAHELSTDPKLALEYARKVLGKPFPQGEPAIARDPQWAYEYARNVLQGPFPLGEPVIAQDPNWAYWYALNALDGPFPLGEPTIAQNARCQTVYLLTFPERREVFDV